MLLINSSAKQKGKSEGNNSGIFTCNKNSASIAGIQVKYVKDMKNILEMQT